MKINMKKQIKSKPKMSKAIKKKKLTKSADETLDDGKNFISINKKSGIVYFGRIPHGFYEQEMRNYFSQFGKVKKTRVARSKKTGRSKGFGYVEFADAEVAKVVAETMNNYLMGNRLIKAVMIPNDKNYFVGRNWNKKHFPGLLKQKEEIQNKNRRLHQDKELKLKQRKIDRLNKIKERLEQKGYTWDLGLTPSTTNSPSKVIEVVSESSKEDVSEEENISSNEDSNESGVNGDGSSDAAVDDEEELTSEDDEDEDETDDDDDDGDILDTESEEEDESENEVSKKQRGTKVSNIQKERFKNLLKRRAGGSISKKKNNKSNLKTNQAFSKAAKAMLKSKGPELKNKGLLSKKLHSTKK